MYKASNISHKVGKKIILQHIHLTVKPGRFTAVLGPNGAGKSTLLKIMAGEQKATEGKVLINTAPVQTLTNAQLSVIRAVLPQHTHLTFPFTVLEIVQLGRLPYKTTQAQNLTIIQQIMQETDTWHLSDRIYTSLSGGEKQRVQLGRVMAQIYGERPESRYLLLDEPTSSLDMCCQHLVLGKSKGLCTQNIGILAILHDLNLAAQYADYVLFLKNGKEVAQGPVDQVMTQEIIEETFSHPVKIIYDPNTRRPVIYSTPTIFPSNKSIQPILNFHSNE